MASPLSPPPPLLASGDSVAVAQARQRFASKPKFSRFLSLQNIQQSSSNTFSPIRPGGSRHSEAPPIPHTQSDPDIHHPATADSPTRSSIALDEFALEHNEDSDDQYEWAVLYENQRGLTVFSTPYYSKLSLLPIDPLPFTLPNALGKRSHQPLISLADYPLPDGNWRWVSKSWMIDMRTDAGELQPDGFEYNWAFRGKSWRSEVGPFSAGGWVRRRRWIRLMMRPGVKKQVNGNTREPTPNSAHPGRPGPLDSTSTIFSTYGEVTTSDIDGVWQGDVKLDWERYRNLMKRAGRDGRQLEIWKQWLGYKQSSSQPGIEAPSLDTRRAWIIPVVEEYGAAMLDLLVFPNSRAQLVKLLKDGLAVQVAERPDFWSYWQAADG
ncbi:hypothetical protein AX16_009648 [Volvariella volvacea WC 439]|nr:hypothetical protein AX16_009648 [Volvariella volvacea WC 439]